MIVEGEDGREYVWRNGELYVDGMSEADWRDFEAEQDRDLLEEGHPSSVLSAEARAEIDAIVDAMPDPFTEEGDPA